MTVAQDQSPALNKDAFDCPQCGAFANQKWGFSYFAAPGDNFTQAESRNGQWTYSKCARCREYSAWLDDQLIYPSTLVGPIASEDMPEDVREIYDESRRVAAVSRRAGAAMARATLELLVKQIDPDAPARSSLAARLERIIPTVDSSLGKLLTFVRHVGNTIHVPENADDAVVMVLDPDQTAGMSLIFQAINGLVDEKITRPRLANEAYEMVPEEVRDRVERAISAEQ